MSRQFFMVHNSFFLVEGHQYAALTAIPPGAATTSIFASGRFNCGGRQYE
jgi:hypothetical protein